jgi:SpoVK/Ycf46/Vps4 family AAA+-type ATPase
VLQAERRAILCEAEASVCWGVRETCVAKIRVSNGRFGLSFIDALKKSKAGDVLVLSEGEHRADSVSVTNLQIMGAGDPAKTILRGYFDIQGMCKISNVTICPPPFHNAVHLKTAEAHVELDGTTVHGEPTWKYPAIYNSGGTVVMRRSTVRFNKSSAGVFLENNGLLHATDSAVAGLRVIGARAVLINTGVFNVVCQTRGQVEAYGQLSVAPAEGERSLVIENESVCTVEWLRAEQGPWEGLCDASVLRLGRVDVPEDQTYVVYTKGQALIETDSPAVTVFDPDAEPEPEPELELELEPAVDIHHDQSAVDEIADTVDPLAEIMALTGLATVKDQIQAFTRMVRFNQLRAQRGFKSTDMTMHSMFLGNPGTGKTTVARLLGTALHQAGAITRDVFVEVGRRDLVGQHLGSSANLTMNVLESARGGVLFIDEAYALYQANNNEFAEEAIDTILTFMENNRDDIVIIFAGYTDRMQDFLAMNPGLKSRVPNRFDFEDYSPDEIVEIGYHGLLQDDYTVDAELYRRVVADKYARSTDKSNGRWVRNFNQDLVKQMARRVVNDPDQSFDDLARITDDDIYTVVGGDTDQKDANVEILLEQLESMVGLAEVKTWVRKLVNRVKVDQQRMQQGGSTSRPTYHMVFAGNPGTGKTTVAKIIAQLFYNLGLLESATVKEVDRSSLVGRYIGHTEENTSKAIDAAMGGVLFVDEAYQLQVEGSASDFGQQAIETFMTRLENDRDKFVAIFAGYTDNMQSFLSANPGLRSRIPLTIEFADFSPAEVGAIVVARLANDWTFDETVLADAAARTYAALDKRDRSNGRWARTFAERIEAEHIEYVAVNGITGAAMRCIPVAVITALTVA